MPDVTGTQSHTGGVLDFESGEPDLGRIKSHFKAKMIQNPTQAFGADSDQVNLFKSETEPRLVYEDHGDESLSEIGRRSPSDSNRRAEERRNDRGSDNHSGKTPQNKHRQSAPSEQNPPYGCCCVQGAEWPGADGLKTASRLTASNGATHLSWVEVIKRDSESASKGQTMAAVPVARALVRWRRTETAQKAPNAVVMSMERHQPDLT
jgi:hypothetical protein